MDTHPTVKISVRTLVEFILRHGDITPSSGALASAEAMQAGTRLHKTIQSRAGSNYQAEVSLQYSTVITDGTLTVELIVDGRADGVLSVQPEQKASLALPPDAPSVIIDEIKGVYRDVQRMKEPELLHLAQAKCYAFIYAKQEKLDEIGVRMTYGNLDGEEASTTFSQPELRYFHFRFTKEELEAWFQDLIQAYSKWALWLVRHRMERNASIRDVEFPFPYRPGQKDLVSGVYRCIKREKNLFIEAPTGVGKTMSTLYPAVKAVGEGMAEKIFYLTAKTITRTVSQEAFSILAGKGMKLHYVTITAKDKTCIFDKAQCDPELCPRAKGHFDRINDAVYALLTTEAEIDRDSIEEYAKRYEVCPFEMCLDISLWVDAVICDYNYVFDPHVALKRFFSQEKSSDYVFLIDEAHNLVERAREMYSAELYKEDFLEIRRLFLQLAGNKTAATICKRLSTCNKELLKLKNEGGDGLSLLESMGSFSMHVLRLVGNMEDFLQENSSPGIQGLSDNTSGQGSTGKEGDTGNAFTPPKGRFSREEHMKVLEFYFELRSFLQTEECLDENYTIYTNFSDDGRFYIRLQCMNPATCLGERLQKGRSAIFFSATLLPINYYKEQLSGDTGDYAIYAPSPFPKENRLLMVAPDVSTRYKRRNEKEYAKIADYILRFVQAKSGNYLVFFPSYRMLADIAHYLDVPGLTILLQKPNMTEAQKEEFLEMFTEDSKTRVGLCVMGGIFGEGIDLKADRLIGAVVVGTGLPQVCDERELFRSYYEEMSGRGFDYAYLYNGMNKVLQSAGRVVRTDTDKGAILLLDERFLDNSYQQLFPREWFPHEVVTLQGMDKLLENFWKST